MGREQQRLATSGPAGQARANVVGSNPHRFAGGGLDDLGEWVAANGFDAMLIDEGAEKYYVLLNRGAVYVQG